MGNPWIVIAVAAALVVAVAAYRLWRRVRLSALRDRAVRQFADLRGELAGTFLEQAASTGKPRGLRWTNCELTGPPLFVVERRSDELFAFVAATVSFAAIEGGPMEEVEAVGNLRVATAVFVHRCGQWTTDGRAVFNLEPAEAIQRFPATFHPLNDGAERPPAGC